LKKARGSLTVEAAIILPVYILVLVFLANFLNIFYLHQAVQYGLNNAGSILAQYCYAVDKTVGMDQFAVSEDTKDKAVGIADAINGFSSAANDALTAFDQGLTLDNLPNLLNSGKNFAGATSNLAGKLRSVGGQDVVNYLLASAGEAGGGMVVKSIVEDYLDQMKVNRSLLDGDIQYALYLDSTDGRYDLVLKASYCYSDSLFSLFTKGFAVEQQAVFHPWIGGESPGLRGKLVG
jgi:hypothetical protein